MSKVDFKRKLRHLYQPRKDTISEVIVPPMNYLMINGRGDPNTNPAYQEAVEALYALSFAIKFMCKPEMDYVVLPLEGLWWSPEGADPFLQMERDLWHWTMMIMQPDIVTATIVAAARDHVASRKQLPALPAIRFEAYDEGTAVQTLYVGPYSEERATIARIHDYITTNGFEVSGHHHEIYLSDPRRVAPERLKTILRQPVRERPWKDN